MRNLKRALSLALASVMVLGLMVVGSSAKGYDDVTSEENVEAIEVLQAVGIMTGDDNGNFNPTQNVTRNEMAVIMSNLMDYRVATYKGTSPFTDVPEWAEPYVAACYTNGIIAGYSATTFGGSDPVVTSQATLMILKALGYFQNASDFGDDWQLATINQANRADLLEDVDSAVRVPMTRNDVAQLVLNGLEAGTVEADNSNRVDVTIGDSQVSVGGTKYNFVTNARDYAYAIDDRTNTNNDGDMTNGAIVELGEKLYNGDLMKTEGNDDLGRPATIWEYQTREIGTYAEAHDYIWTAKVTSKSLYDTIGRTAAEYKNWEVYFNGDLMDDYNGQNLIANRTENDTDFYKRATSKDALTANGVVTQVYVNGTDQKVTVAVTEYMAAEVLRVNDSDETITLADLSNATTYRAKSTDTFDTDDFAEDDIVVYAYAQGKIQEVYPAERIEGEVTSIRTDTTTDDAGYGGKESTGSRFVVDGETYRYNRTSVETDRLSTDNLNNNVVAYTDANGYVVYVDQSAITYDYAYVLSMGTDRDAYGWGNNDRGTTVYARLVLADGTMVRVQTDAKVADIGRQASANGQTYYEPAAGANKLLNHIVAYSVDKSGVYTLIEKSGGRYISKAENIKIDNGVASFRAEDATITFGSDHTGRYAANSNTIFVIAERDNESYDDYNYTVYTGVKNVPDITGDANTTAVVATGDASKASTLARMVYIEDAKVSGEDVIFVRADKRPDYQRDNDLGRYYLVNAFDESGEQFQLQIKEGSAADRDLVELAQDTTRSLDLGDNRRAIVAIKSYTENSDGLVTSVRAYGRVDSNGDGVRVGVGTEKAETSVLGLKNHGWFTWDEDKVLVGRYGENNVGNFVAYGINSVKRDSDFPYIAVMDGDVITGIVVWETYDTPDVDQTGDVVFASGLTRGTGNGQDGVLSNARVETLGSGASSMSFDLTAPDWAYTKVTSSANVKVLYRVLLDGEVYNYGHVNGLYDLDPGANGSDRGYQAIKANSDGTVFSVNGFSLTDDISANAVSNAKANGKPGKVSVEITDVQWLFTKVNYTLGGTAMQAVTGADVYVPSLCSRSNVASGWSFEIGVDCTSDMNVQGTYTVSSLTYGGTAPASSSVTKVGVAETIAHQVWASAKAPVTVAFVINDSNVKYTVNMGNGQADSGMYPGKKNIYLSAWLGNDQPAGVDTAVNTIVLGGPLSQQVSRNGKATITLEMLGGASEPFIVYLEGVPGAETQAKILEAGNAQGVSFDIDHVTQNITVAQTNIKLIPVAKPVPVAASINGHYTAVKFNMPVTLDKERSEGTTDGSGNNIGNTFKDMVERGFIEDGYVTGDNKDIVVIKWKSDDPGAGFIMPRYSIDGVTTAGGISRSVSYAGTEVYSTAANGNIKADSTELPQITGFTLPN